MLRSAWRAGGRPCLRNVNCPLGPATKLSKPFASVNSPVLRITYTLRAYGYRLSLKLLWLGYTVAEVSCPTKYFEEASSINFSRSVRYGLGCVATAIEFRLAKLQLVSSRLFPASLEDAC